MRVIGQYNQTIIVFISKKYMFLLQPWNVNRHNMYMSLAHMQGHAQTGVLNDQSKFMVIVWWELRGVNTNMW